MPHYCEQLFSWRMAIIAIDNGDHMLGRSVYKVPCKGIQVQMAACPLHLTWSGQSRPDVQNHIYVPCKSASKSVAIDFPMFHTHLAALSYTSQKKSPDSFLEGLILVLD